MSRDILDRYYTPGWCVDVLATALRREWTLRLGDPDVRVLEPAVGGGALASGLQARGCVWEWFTNDIDPAVVANQYDDFLEAVALGDLGEGDFDAVITNPPYSLCSPFVRAALTITPHVALLMPLTWCEPAQERVTLWQETPPGLVLALPRPSFTGDGRTDGRTVAWFIWWHGSTSTRLEVVPPSVRNAWRDAQRGQGSLL